MAKSKKDRLLRVGQYDYELRHTDDLEAFKAGECDYTSKTLKVMNGLRGVDYWETVLHEMIHGYLMEYGHLQYLPHEINEAMSETVARLLSSQIDMKWKKTVPVISLPSLPPIP